MIETNIKDLSVEEIMQKIKQEVEKRKQKTDNIVQNNYDIRFDFVNVVDNTIEPFVQKEQYEYDDFAKYHDEEFIKNCYRGLLKREADSEGLQYYLNLLRSGGKSQSEIISILHYSKEGKSKNIKLLGSKKRYTIAMLNSLPIFGSIFKWITTLVTLPRLIKRVNQYENFSYQLYMKNIDNETKLQNALNENIQDSLTSLNAFVNTKADKSELQNKADKSELQNKADKSELQNKADKSELQNKADKSELQNKADKSELQNKADKSELQNKADKSELQNKADKSELQNKVNLKDIELYLQTVSYAKEYMKISQQNMQTLIDEAKKRLPDEVLNQKELVQITEEEKHKFDTFYVEFEDKFRGSREDIKEKVKVYLSYIEKLPFDKEEIKALDVGCGRGEWIELLEDKGYDARGIDLNRVMVAKSQELGLDAKEADVIDYLQSLEDESLSVITGFHIIEHLPFEALMKMYEESYRVLKKGGMVIFETPNPENLMVGACNFYDDPTHLNPIPPHSTNFLVEKSGFRDVKILRLHQPDNIHFDNLFLNHQFAIGQDYAIIGYKI